MSPPPRRSSPPALLWIVAACALGASPASAQEPACPAASGADAEAGWTAYREGDLDAARARFGAALERCPDDLYARTGLGYVELREGEDAEARRLFQAVVAARPDDVDALVGLGLLAWRVGDLDAVAERFGRVLELAPGHPTALDYLERLSPSLGPAPEREPLVLPDTLEYPARVAGDRFEVRSPEGWRPFYVKGVNLGAALPGRHPSQFPDSATYARWIRGMAEMNANVVRVYTIHPPGFYEALRDWNLSHPARPLWLVHGVWTELPEDHDYRAEDFESGFFAEMRRVVDLIHGRADLQPRAGHASGYYLADVSEWTLAYIIGREWEPFSALAFDSIQEARGVAPGHQGRYLRLRGGNAMDAWLARASEEIVAYETETYRAQRPVAYTNWPTLDPLSHPTETTVDEEMAIRRARGEDPRVRPREYDNDVLGLDASLLSATDALPAGVFASYHAYPYYPDFMVADPAYLEAESSLGPSTYFGYLEALKSHHGAMPVLVSEYGVPASLGTAHLQPQGWHHGGLTEAEMAEVDRRLTLEIAEAGMAGGILFAWIDEWFKKNWVVIDFELPGDRNRLWYNRLDAEQHYGMWAMEARAPLQGATLPDRMEVWSEVAPLYGGTPEAGPSGPPAGRGGITLRAAHDAAYLWLLVEAPARGPADTLMVGFDMIRPDAGDFRWPGRRGPRLTVGLEFVLMDDGRAVRILADPPQNAFVPTEVGQGARGLEGRTIPVENPPPGLFRDRVELRYNLPYYTRRNLDGRYDSLEVVVNRRRFSRDSTEYLAMGYDRGVLPPGTAPDGFWERSADGTVLEVRIPWGLLNVTDPSSRRVLQGPGDNIGLARRGADGRWTLRSGVSAWPGSLSGALGTETVEDIGIVAALGGDGAWRMAPEGETAGQVARFGWPGWEEPDWRARARPTAGTMAEVYAQLDPWDRRQGVAPDPPPAPEPSPAEEANRAWIEGDQEQARTLYRQMLEANPVDGVALHRLALMRAWDGEYGTSLALFDRLLAVQPDNVDARVARARVLAWRDDLEEALDSLDAVLEQHPGYVDALEARALFEAWAGRYEASLSIYDQLLGISPDNASARRSQAQVLSWASRYEASRAVYDSLLAVDPGDVDARLGLARALTFSDDLDEAAAEYRRVLDADPTNPDALAGLGRVLSWAGDLVEGEEVFRRAVATDGGHVASLVGLALNLRWQGRNAAALEILLRAERTDPNNGDVREQLRWVRAALDPRTRPSITLEGDSDGNRMTTTAVMAAWNPRLRLGVRVDAYQRFLEQEVLERSALGLTVTGSYQFEPGWTVSAGLGGSRNDGRGRTNFTALRMDLSSPGRYDYGGTVTVSTRALDATALLADKGVRMSQLQLSGRWTPTGRWRVHGGLGTATLDGTEENTRRSASLSVARRLSGPWTVGAGLRTFGYDRDLADGYFDPDFYGIAELTGRWLHEPGAWSLLVELAPGMQQVTSEGEATGTVRASARVAYRVAPGREVSLSGGYSSTGLQSFSTGTSDYRYAAVILGATWIF